jgi:hypothetical protein
VRIPSLQEIVLVGHREKVVELVRREKDGSWSRIESRSGGVVKLASLGCEISVEDVYRDPLAG